MRNISSKLAKDKKAQEWSVMKIMTFVLIIVFLGLVIFGLINGKLTPLLKKVGTIFDSVLVGLKLKNVQVDNTKQIAVPGFGTGTLVFDLDKMECTLNVKGKNYRLNFVNNKLEVKEEVVFIKSSSKTRLWGDREYVFTFFDKVWYFSYSKGGRSWIPVLNPDFLQTFSETLNNYVQLKPGINSVLDKLKSSYSYEGGIKIIQEGIKSIGAMEVAEEWVDVIDGLEGYDNLKEVLKNNCI